MNINAAIDRFIGTPTMRFIAGTSFDPPPIPRGPEKNPTDKSNIVVN